MKRAGSSIRTWRKTVSVSGPASSRSIAFGLSVGCPKSVRTARCPEDLQAIACWHLIITHLHLGCCCWLVLCKQIINQAKHLPSSDERHFTYVPTQFFILIIIIYRTYMCYYNTKNVLRMLLKMFKKCLKMFWNPSITIRCQIAPD